MSILRDSYDNYQNARKELQDLLQELKINKNINKFHKLENTVDIDYIIERITRILEEG